MIAQFGGILERFQGKGIGLQTGQTVKVGHRPQRQHQLVVMNCFNRHKGVSPNLHSLRGRINGLDGGVEKAGAGTNRP